MSLNLTHDHGKSKTRTLEKSAFFSIQNIKILSIINNFSGLVIGIIGHKYFLLFWIRLLIASLTENY